MAAEPRNAEVRIELSRVLAASGDFGAALQAAESASRLVGPGDPRALEQMASVLADAGDADRLAPIAEALTGSAAHDEAAYYSATALFLKGQVGHPIADDERAVAGRLDAFLTGI